MRTYSKHYHCECRTLCSLEISDQAFCSFNDHTIGGVSRILSNKCPNLSKEQILRKGKECTIVEY